MPLWHVYSHLVSGVPDRLINCVEDAQQTVGTSVEYFQRRNCFAFGFAADRKGFLSPPFTHGFRVSCSQRARMGLPHQVTVRQPVVAVLLRVRRLASGDWHGGAWGSVLSEATSCVGKSGGEGEALYGTI